MRKDGSTPGLGDIRIYFPDSEEKEKEENWEEIPWDEFLEQFEKQNSQWSIGKMTETVM